MWRSSGRPAALAVALALTACAAEGPGAPDAADSATARPGVAEDPPKANIEQVRLRSEPVPARPAPEPAPVDDDPGQLVGLGPGDLEARLGHPGFVRRDGDAEIWQYPAEACILDVFLYREAEGFSVAHVALRGRGAVQQSRRECFAAMLRARLRQTTG